MVRLRPPARVMAILQEAGPDVVGPPLAEAAIRADPKGPWAELAYAQLEETQVLGFGGASSHHLPPDVWTGLRELRELMGRESLPAAP